jgi:diaminopimelate decarboxylase
MDHFNYRQDRLYAENVEVADIAEIYGTPCYIYSRATIERHWHAFDTALGTHPHLVCYAVKANSNLAVLNVLARLGSGFDIVSGGELQRVITAHGDPSKIVFSGVGKRADEMRSALQVGIRCFNIESRAELERLSRIAAAMGVDAPVSLRVNPDVDANTHPYISTGLRNNKFGIAIEEALEVYRQAADLPCIYVVGIDCHIGSQLTELSPFIDALKRVVRLAEKLSAEGISVKHLDLGGGLGIRYRDETPPLPHEYASAIFALLESSPYEIFLEPGRAIMGNAGILVTKVEYLKHASERNFAIVDTAMNDLMRPALYDAWQDIIPVAPQKGGESYSYDVVGPICESGDFIGKQRPLNIAADDLLAVRSAGAYGFSMSSNYNSRPRAAEIMVDGEQVHLIRERETFDQLIQGERLLPNTDS